MEVTQEYAETNPQKGLKTSIRTIRDLFNWAEENGLADCPIGLQYQNEDGRDIHYDTMNERYWSMCVQDPEKRPTIVTEMTFKYSDFQKNHNFKKSETFKYIRLG